MTLPFEHIELLYNMSINLSRVYVDCSQGDMMDLNQFSLTVSRNHDEVGQSQPLQHMHIENRQSRALL